MNDKIDVVLTWVNPYDLKWLKEKEHFINKGNYEAESNSNIRFESWDNLHLWFRAIEKFMPWVNRVVLITYGHTPDFLRLSHPKLKVVRHDEYIPSGYLPTYNSNTIEMNIHRISDLEENFILFNDDIFPLKYIEEEYYFRNNMVCDEAVENIITTAQFGSVANMSRYTQINNMFFINKYYKKREVQKLHWEKWYCEDYGERLDRTKSLQYWNDFPGFYDPHLPSAMKKSVLKHLWEIEFEKLDKASKNHFRAYDDLTQYLIRYWQICSGQFYPRRTKGKVFFIDINNYKDVASQIKNREHEMICINENCTIEEFDIIKNEINAALEEILSEKSSFEL